MDTQAIVRSIDAHIDALEQAKALLTQVNLPTSHRFGVINRRHVRHLSADARKRISDAQKRRWAKQKKAA